MKKVIYAAFACSLLCTAHTYANDTTVVSERERLTNVIKELEFIQAYLEETQHAQKHNIKNRFSYEKVDYELGVVKNGIAEYVNQRFSQPKAAPESKIIGEYLQ